MVWRAAIMAGVAVALSGCAVTLNVRGQVDRSAETFTGTIVANIDSDGTIQVVSNRGVRCSGQYVVVTRREGTGTLTCDDGRSGPFQFAAVGTRGTGSGRLGGETMTFTFGP